MTLLGAQSCLASPSPLSPNASPGLTDFRCAGVFPPPLQLTFLLKPGTPITPPWMGLGPLNFYERRGGGRGAEERFKPSGFSLNLETGFEVPPPCRSPDVRDSPRWSAAEAGEGTGTPAPLPSKSSPPSSPQPQHSPPAPSWGPGSAWKLAGSSPHLGTCVYPAVCGGWGSQVDPQPCCKEEENKSFRQHYKYIKINL